jgi:hypothetical protein
MISQMKDTSRIVMLILAVATIFIVPLQSSYSQNDSLSGDWTIFFEMSNGQTADIPLNIQESDGELLVSVRQAEESILFPTTIEDDKLKMELVLGHGSIDCELYADDRGAFAGLCVGPMGESSALLKRTK